MGHFRRQTGEERNGYNIKTNIDLLHLVLLNIDHGNVHNFLLLLSVHHGLGCPKCCLPFGFDLDKDQCRSIPGNDIDFATSTTIILLLNTVALTLQKNCTAILVHRVDPAGVANYARCSLLAWVNSGSTPRKLRR